MAGAACERVWNRRACELVPHIQPFVLAVVLLKERLSTKCERV